MVVASEADWDIHADVFPRPDHYFAYAQLSASTRTCTGYSNIFLIPSSLIFFGTLHPMSMLKNNTTEHFTDLGKLNFPMVVQFQA